MWASVFGMTDYPDPINHHPALFGGVKLTQWDPEPLPPAGQAAFDRFMALTPDALIPASRHVFAYYQDMMQHLGGQGWPGIPLPKLDDPSQVWDHVTPTGLIIQSDWDASGPWYIGIEANIPWEVEHGLVMFWEDGHKLVKVGRVDGHVTNANSYADPALEGVVYAALAPQFRTLADP